MIIRKWVELREEVEIEISMASIREAMAEAFGEIITPLEPGPAPREVKRALNDIAAFLNALTEKQIAALEEPARKIVGSFLAEQSARFLPTEPISVTEALKTARRKKANGVKWLDR
jgi:hypothetical protein